MSLHDDDSFDPLVARLEAERPRLDGHELDRLSLRCRSRSTRPQQSKEQPMRSRIAVTAMLVLGVMLSTTGVGLAVSGSSGSGSAGSAQYPTKTTPSAAGGQGGGYRGAVDVRPPPAAGDTPADENGAPAVQVTRQLSAESDANELPFTGFAVFPIIAAGVLLLFAGLFLRRRSGQSPV
jgi:hypothetical protein